MKEILFSFGIKPEAVCVCVWVCLWVWVGVCARVRARAFARGPYDISQKPPRVPHPWQVLKDDQYSWRISHFPLLSHWTY